MNLIFLDLHGVIIPMTNDGAGYSPQCIAALNRITETTGAKIVLSCNWRAAVYGELALAGVVASVIGRTRDELTDDEPRWKQIADWLNKPPVNVGRYCILDDDPKAFGRRPGVLVNSLSGLTEADADAAIEILGAIRAGNVVGISEGEK